MGAVLAFVKKGEGRSAPPRTPDMYRCKVDGKLVTPRTFHLHAGHTVTEPVDVTWREWLWLKLRLIR